MTSFRLRIALRQSTLGFDHLMGVVGKDGQFDFVTVVMSPRLRYHCWQQGDMARVLIRDLDERTVEKLKARASRNRRSLQAELQMIVERAAAIDAVESRDVAARIRRKLSRRRKHSDSAALVADDRRR